MITDINPFPNKVTIDAEQHRYFHQDGREFISVNKVIDKFCTPFDVQMMSRLSAGKKVKESGADVEVVAKQLQKEWKQNGQQAADRGTYFHYLMEIYLSSGQVGDAAFAKPVRRLACHFNDFYRTFAEVICYDEISGVAGMEDCVSLHSVRSKDLLHLRDFKTNKEIPFPDKKYLKWMKPPFDHLPDDKFTRYCLAQSCYARMLQKWGFRIRSISLLWIDMNRLGEEVFWTEIPVPFMAHEAEKLLFSNLIQDELI